MSTSSDNSDQGTPVSIKDLLGIGGEIPGSGDKEKPALNDEEKRNAVKEFAEMTAGHTLIFFKMLGLNSFIDATIVNEPTDERFIFRFYKVGSGYTTPNDALSQEILRLNSELFNLRKERDHLLIWRTEAEAKLIEVAQACGIFSNENDKLKAERDQFAIGFAEWLDLQNIYYVNNLTNAELLIRYKKYLNLEKE
jgi:hypothetical protein